MIDSAERLLVMAENDAGTDIPWYHLAYQHARQETPYRFRSAAQLTDPSELDASCRPNRGPSSAPLFLLNHWVDTSPTPRASIAAIVNARDALLARARACERIRGRKPNLIAVDFYRRGDLFGVVDALNGLEREPPPAGDEAARVSKRSTWPPRASASKARSAGRSSRKWCAWRSSTAPWRWPRSCSSR
jgi:hypothetical protein